MQATFNEVEPLTLTPLSLSIILVTIMNPYIHRLWTVIAYAVCLGCLIILSLDPIDDLLYFNTVEIALRVIMEDGTLLGQALILIPLSQSPRIITFIYNGTFYLVPRYTPNAKKSEPTNYSDIPL